MLALPSIPMLPAYEYGRIDCGPCSAAIAVSRVAAMSSASSQLMRSKRPSPFWPTRRIGWSSRSGL
jgi:hypothetical protein